MPALVRRLTMGIIEWARSPWGQDVPIHIAFYLIWVSAIAGFVFLIGHAIWVRHFAKPEEFAVSAVAAGASVRGGGTKPVVSALPEKIARHSLAARLFHWIMAA